MENKFKIQNSFHFLRFLTNILVFLVILFLVVSFLFAILNGFFDLKYFAESLETGVQKVIQTIAYSLAMLELIITAMGYFRDGRFHVTNIIDTILIILLYEVAKIWFLHQFYWDKVSLLLFAIVVIFSMRVVAIKFHPTASK